MKKIIVFFGIVALMLIAKVPRTDAAYLPGQNINWSNMSLEIPYLDTADDGLYILVSNNIYYTYGSGSAYVYSVEFINEAPYGAVINYDYTDLDFILQNETFKQNKLIGWFGGSEGLFLLNSVEIVKVVGGHTLPDFTDAAKNVYTFSNNFGTVSNYEGIIWYNTNPLNVVARVLDAEYGGYVQGVVDTTPGIEEARKLGYDQALAETTSSYEYILQNIYEITIPSRERLQYEQGRRDGYVLGYETGINVSIADTVNFNWIQTLFMGLGAFLSIELFGGISIGMIVGIPLVFGLVFFILKLVRG